MLGALLGDIFSSVHRDSLSDDVEFELSHPDCSFTDETVLTIAIANAIANGESFQYNIRKFAKEYQDIPGGYGSNFKFWLYTGGDEPYMSLGIGPAARVSPVGWAFDDLATTLNEAEKSARATHEHVDAVKGAVALAHGIYLGKKGFEAESIRKTISENYGYELKKCLYQLQADPVLEATTPVLMPLVFISALEAKSTETAVVNAVRFGAPTGALASMTGAFAEALYGIPEHLKQEVLRRLPEKFLNVMAHFREIQANQLALEQRGSHAA